ncbi:MAG: hypothetical protein GW762_00615 [Candidatus Pacebacteria bacterium]|nr:hypothetical protein [Candidatus Paceibacterota bacterium]PIR63698.1 MAG: hypothetical protein COU64_03110 [Candidatus Pacebacteria bacterium CG10_big_fil_rev_8_21_14_0_10_40_26]PIZ79701.1 MAG: hypothetical protein COY01_00150 [Candidatus Pacebacteria bacterium CG_4_10_14_0_2_um_filter_40_20]PJA68345.1 MAG: hypothetical protein CO156_05105 [Candidatus Pacebacteria bacterium CG_4_9_14_3_um_filter_40_12]PJC41207.1 MAG: hypothetical protein CO041_05175 [Candidatus Pacebacteria bacterium CG_4_9_
MTGTVAFASGAEVSKKFKLYLKVREIKGIKKVISEIEQLPLGDREEWIEEYGDMINTALDNFVDDSSFSFENIFNDDETLALSQELVSTLKDTIQSVEGMLYPDSLLES